MERLSQAFDDASRHSGFLALAESAVGACPGDPIVLTLSATAALLDERPERALVFLKRISKRYTATPTDHLLQALALFQDGKRVAARALLERHGLTEWSRAPSFPGRKGTHAMDGGVNADLIFPKSAEPKFPTLAGAAISRRRDRGLRFLAAGRAA